MKRRMWCGVLGALLFSAPAFAADTGHMGSQVGLGAGLEGSTEAFHIEFRNADLKEALRFLARIADMNLVIPEGITGVVSVRLENTRVLDAINALTRSNGLEYAVERGILRVGRSDQFTSSGEDLKTQTVHLKYALAKDMAAQVKNLLTTRGSVLADERTNSLVVRETLANIEHVGSFVNDVDIRDAQVLIEAKIVEATRSWTRNLGIQWGANSTTFPKANVVGIQAVGADDAGRRLNVNLPALAPRSGLGLIIGTLGGGTNIDLQITAAEQKGDLHVISEPSIVTSNGVEAHIRSGEKIYVKTAGTVSIGAASAAGSSTGLQEIKTGVDMKVTPQISVGDYVKMQILATTSAPDFTRTVDGIPAIIDNEATTTVLVHNGEMTIIGGLIRFRGQHSKDKVPMFGDLPLLGYLFQSRQRNKTNSDLMVFIRPNIVHDVVDSPLQEALPKVETVRKDMMVNDDVHFPEKYQPKLGRELNNGKATRYRSRYENYRNEVGH